MALDLSKIQEVRFNLGDLDKLLFEEDSTVQIALDKEDGDINCATARLFEVIAADKALSAKRLQLGNKTVEEDYKPPLEMAKFYRGKAGQETGNLPPMVGVHTDGEYADGRPEFNKIGIEDVEEGVRSDQNIKASDGSKVIE